MRDATEAGREAFARRAWREAHDALAAADRAGTLDADDLERLATAAHLVGDDDADAWSRAYHRHLAAGHRVAAARCAFLLAMGLFARGEPGRAGGWLARAQRMADGAGDAPETGYLLAFEALELLDRDPAAAVARFARVADMGERAGDPDLATLGTLGHGQALVGTGRLVEGLTRIDEALVAVTADEVSPIVAGVVYCAAIESCVIAFDVRRAAEWTTALSRWCDTQPDLVPFRGQCLAHRSEVLQLQGAWGDAADAAQRACEHLAGAPAVGHALYQRAELLRLRGDLEAAEEAFVAAHRAGREPQPGLALLRLARGDVESARAQIGRALAEAVGPAARARLLGPCVEIALAGGDVPAARTAADELASLAAEMDAPLVRAAADHALGSVLLAEGDAAAALVALRRALTGWHALDVGYQAARVRTTLALACRSLGDDDTAALELEAARLVFDELGATPELSRLAALSGPSAPIPAPAPAPPRGAHPLTAREAEVLTLVARGDTNRQVAAALRISDKTVARHLSNIFTKLDVPSRAAATAWAYEHGVMGPPG